MVRDARFSRRTFLVGSAGAAAAVGLAGYVPTALGAGQGNGERLVPPELLGIQQFSIRDATTRRSIANSLANGLTPTMGYLGGPGFPDDPTDLGPLVPLPGGFVEVFEYLASVGYRGFEFFQFSQNINELGRQPTIAEVRSYLDGAGLVGQGTHTASIGTMYSAATGGLSTGGQTQIDNAHILGLPQVGFAGDPSGRNTLADNPTNPNQIGWAEAARRANIVAAALADAGIKYYWHVEQNGYNGFDPVIHPELLGTNRLTWFFDNTDPNLLSVEPDTFHGYAGRSRFPFPDGSLFDIFGWWQDHYHQIVAWHIKDGTRISPAPTPPANPFTQTILRPPTFAPGGLANNDALYTGEGSIGIGFPVDPDPGVVGFRTIFDEVGAKGSRFYQVESDNAIGGTADPGRSLRHAKLGAQYLLGLRAGPSAKATSTDVSEEVSHEHEE
jgi:sugar phosphate isomerase/epimerase